jgi:hypothetical protein
MKNLRLTDVQVSAIRSAFTAYFTEQDHLWVFGSRVDLSQRGGDLDIYIETHLRHAAAVTDAKLGFLACLQMMMGEQKIDVVINAGQIDLPIYAVAKSEGVQII